MPTIFVVHVCSFILAKQHTLMTDVNKLLRHLREHMVSEWFDRIVFGIVCGRILVLQDDEEDAEAAAGEPLPCASFAGYKASVTAQVMVEFAKPPTERNADVINCFFVSDCGDHVMTAVELAPAADTSVQNLFARMDSIRVTTE